MELPAYYQRLAVTFKDELVEGSKESNWDRRNEATGEQYCVHGQNIGTWDGPDYMCGYCEEGTSHEDVGLDRAHAQWASDRRMLGRSVRELLIPPDEGPKFWDVVSTEEGMAVWAVAAFLEGEFRRDVKTMRDAIDSFPRQGVKS